MLSRFDGSSSFLDCAQRTTWMKACVTNKSEGLYQVFILLRLFLLLLPNCSFYSILTTAFLCLCSSLDSSHLLLAVCPKQDIGLTKFDLKLNFWTVLRLTGLEIRSRESMHPYFIKRWGLSSLFIILETFTFLERVILIFFNKSVLIGTVISMHRNIIISAKPVL